ncbi:hypothetical protein BKA62DRAFT_829154 [Auriculariales sp. MPI-PUGE-AT-0066]|nr:hypothetical protein BKA62DRAFT_829154 [Auriculariales sp. MPI-PUGE-AT-0066]
MLTLIFWLLVSFASAMASGGALAPRASIVPADYWATEYFCPTFSDVTLFSVDYQDPLDEYWKKLACHQSCGERTADPPSSAHCGIRCAKILPNGYYMYEYSNDGSEIMCAYYAPEGNMGRGCTYNPDGTDVYEQGDCLPAWNSCDGPFKRRYRRQDNYTAWLKKRKAKARENVPAIPAPSR